MNGAQAMIRTFVDAGVTTCFMNPGTSEMHFVAALDDVPEMRAVLALFEGVATGAADGFGRMSGMPAATLLHLGPGLGNGLANLHNARRAATPVVNVVGDHATAHLRCDSPLQSDIESAARNVSAWIRRPTSADELTAVTAEAVAAALGPPGSVVTVIVPADVSWTDGARPAPPLARRQRAPAGQEAIDAAAKTLRAGEPCALLLGGAALRRQPLHAAARIAAGTSAKLLSETFAARCERGAGIPTIERLQYFAEQAQRQLAGIRHLILVNARAPVAFFAYPERPSDLTPEDCEVLVLAGDADDAGQALEQLADEVGSDAPVPTVNRPALPTGALTLQAVAAAVGALLPEAAIVSDESTTAGWLLADATIDSPPHDWLQLTGGAIGQGLPVATGAAVACPDRPVISLAADGSSMYTIQSLWTQARESLDVTTIVLNNRSYAILNIELARTGAGEAGPRAREMLDLSRPELDFVHLAEGMGVPAVAATTADDLTAELARALAEPGPHLIDAVLVPR